MLDAECDQQVTIVVEYVDSTWPLQKKSLTGDGNTDRRMWVILCCVTGRTVSELYELSSTVVGAVNRARPSTRFVDNTQQRFAFCDKIFKSPELLGKNGSREPKYAHLGSVR